MIQTEDGILIQSIGEFLDWYRKRIPPLRIPVELNRMLKDLDQSLLMVRHLPTDDDLHKSGLHMGYPIVQSALGKLTCTCSSFHACPRHQKAHDPNDFLFRDLAEAKTAIAKATLLGVI